MMLVGALLTVSYYDILLICCSCDVILFQCCHAFTVKVVRNCCGSVSQCFFSAYRLSFNKVKAAGCEVGVKFSDL